MILVGSRVADIVPSAQYITRVKACMECLVLYLSVKAIETCIINPSLSSIKHPSSKMYDFLCLSPERSASKECNGPRLRNWLMIGMWLEGGATLALWLLLLIFQEKNLSFSSVQASPCGLWSVGAGRDGEGSKQVWRQE